MRNSFINKVTRVYKVLTVANSISLCSTAILVVFPEFVPVDRAEISHMHHHRIRPGNRAIPVTGLI